MVFKNSKDSKDRCSNPFDYEGHLVRKGLKFPSNTLIKSFPNYNFSRDNYLCAKCRVKLYNNLKQLSGNNVSATNKNKNRKKLKKG